jgi:hypothetical protein
MTDDYGLKDTIKVFSKWVLFSIKMGKYRLIIWKRDEWAWTFHRFKDVQDLGTVTVGPFFTFGRD